MSTGTELLKLLKSHEKYKGKSDYYIKKEIGGKKPAVVEELRKEVRKLGLTSMPEKSKKSKLEKERKTLKIKDDGVDISVSYEGTKKKESKKEKCNYKSGQQVSIISIKTKEDEEAGYEPSFYAVVPGYERGMDGKMIDQFVKSADIVVKNYLKAMQKEDPIFTKAMADKEYNSVITRGGYISTYTQHKYIYEFNVISAKLF